MARSLLIELEHPYADNIITIPMPIHTYGDGDDVEEGGARALADDRISHHPFINLSAEAVQLSPEMRDGAMGREHGEYKRDKARRCSRLVRPLGDRKRDMLQLQPAAESCSPRAPGRPACAGRSPRAALAKNADMVFATSALSTLL